MCKLWKVNTVSFQQFFQANFGCTKSADVEQASHATIKPRVTFFYFAILKNNNVNNVCKAKLK